jgi:energy-coupling factor transporter ATP-binding protein EcfA2
MPPRLAVRDIAKHYGGVQALRGVSLHVEAGEVLGLVGDNSAGKSTMAKILSGATFPSAGAGAARRAPGGVPEPGRGPRRGRRFGLPGPGTGRAARRGGQFLPRPGDPVRPLAVVVFFFPVVVFSFAFVLVFFVCFFV